LRAPSDGLLFALSEHYHNSISRRLAYLLYGGTFRERRAEGSKPASNKTLRNRRGGGGGDGKNWEIKKKKFSWIAVKIKRILAQQMTAKK